MGNRFSQVDVFATGFGGNPVAVWHDATDLTADEMARFARWTNLSETTFLLPPTEPTADYRLRIFTPGGELPFAGHPTLGSCRAWLDAGGTSRTAGVVIQECGAGLVRIRVDGDALAFAAPPLLRSGEPDRATLARAASALGLDPGRIVAASWTDNGPRWLSLLLPDAATVLKLVPPRPGDLADFELGVIGPHPAGGPADYEVRAFCPELSITEDPVTGSLNAGLAQWLMGAGLAPDHYTVAQGTALGRAGRLELTRDAAGQVWVGGVARVLIAGTVTR